MKDSQRLRRRITVAFIPMAFMSYGDGSVGSKTFDAVVENEGFSFFQTAGDISHEKR
jgi:hypothetical protein